MAGIAERNACGLPILVSGTVHSWPGKSTCDHCIGTESSLPPPQMSAIAHRGEHDEFERPGLDAFRSRSSARKLGASLVRQRGKCPTLWTPTGSENFQPLDLGGVAFVGAVPSCDGPVDGVLEILAHSPRRRVLGEPDRGEHLLDLGKSDVGDRQVPDDRVDVGFQALPIWSTSSRSSTSAAVP